MKKYSSALIIWYSFEKKITYFMPEQEEKSIFETNWQILSELLNALSNDGWKIVTHTIEKDVHYWNLQIKN
ncbi:MAG: hypothetical protein EAZ85_04455 [Bacteroidetes bacterium]|nr:MAG: hypothetical protein EAZ85_04455 [Bacteroidota bacterium]TAG88670.1 MAG: hypothetical protein EAZ20_08050 [Bacteroidota bacterium]